MVNKKQTSKLTFVDQKQTRECHDVNDIVKDQRTRSRISKP